MHLCVLASRDRADRVVGTAPRNRGDEYDGVRRAMDAEGHRMAGIRDRAGEFVARGAAWVGGDGEAFGGGAGLCLYDRRAKGASLRGKAVAGHAGAKVGMPDCSFSHWSRARKNV